MARVPRLLIIFQLNNARQIYVIWFFYEDSMATHIIFDLGNVLIHIHPELAMKGFEEACGIKQAKLRKFFLSDLHLGFMEGVYSPGEFFKTMMDIILISTSITQMTIWKRFAIWPRLWMLLSLVLLSLILFRKIKLICGLITC